MKQLLLKISYAILFFTIPLTVFAHPGHSSNSFHGFLHFEHIFIALAIIFFVVINKLIKKYF